MIQKANWHNFKDIVLNRMGMLALMEDSDLEITQKLL